MGKLGALNDELRHIVGEYGFLPSAQIADYSFDGFVPKVVVLPASVQEIQDILRFASEKDLSIMPAGAGTKLGIGNLPLKVDIVLATSRLNRIVEYEASDLTVTVEAGTRLAILQAELAGHGQFLPLDPPYSDKCTVGGIVATNASGPLRTQYGTARNQVLGLRTVHANATLVKSGGKVVKNVAGYDLNKLHIGAFGTLGIIIEVTFKLSPIPRHHAMLTGEFQNLQNAVNVGLSIVGSQTLPMSVNLLINTDSSCRAAAGTSEKKKLTLAVEFGGDPETVTWQLAQCQEIMEQNGAIRVTIKNAESRQHLRQTLREFPAGGRGAERMIGKLNLKRTDIAELAAYVLDVIPAHGTQMMALLGNGVLYLSIPVTAGTDFQDIASTLIQLRQSATALGGNLILETAPPELKQKIDVWGNVGETRGLMKQVKAKFDENGLLNPGRFISNI